MALTQSFFEYVCLPLSLFFSLFFVHFSIQFYSLFYSIEYSPSPSDVWWTTKLFLWVLLLKRTFFSITHTHSLTHTFSLSLSNSIVLVYGGNTIKNVSSIDVCEFEKIEWMQREMHLCCCWSHSNVPKTLNKKKFKTCWTF